MPQSDFWPFTRKRVEAGFDDGQSLLQKQLGNIEGEVKEMKVELAAMKEAQHEFKIDAGMEDVTIYEPCRINDRYKDDNEIVLNLQRDLMHAKREAEDQRLQRLKYEVKLNDLELKLNEICAEGKASDLKDARKITEEEVNGLKTQIRDLKEQTEELKATNDEKTEQVQEYRAKYLQAQQRVEELQIQMALQDFENKQTSEQIQLELQKMKIQFKEKLLELSPLPELLKRAHIQLQEANQMQKLAEENSFQVSDELNKVKDKLVLAVNSLNQQMLENTRLADENIAYKSNLEEKQKILDELSKEYDEYKHKVARLEERQIQMEARYEEKTAEYNRLVKDTEELKINYSRSLCRARETSESVKQYMQNQISNLERQLMTCRAQCNMFQKERDQIRQNMQMHVESLKGSFETVEDRLCHVLGQVNLMKQCYCFSRPDNMQVPPPEQDMFDYV